mgnify:CR=1 FL=1
MAVAVLATPARGEPSDADFLAAKAAFERADRAKLAILAPRLTGHPLQPYVAYWQLRLGLDSAIRDDVLGYASRWPDTPLADRLRGEWLKVLGRRGDWDTFALDYPAVTEPDTEISCYGIQLQRRREGDPALAAAKPLWFTGQATPDACDPLFTALIRSNDLTVTDRLARFRLATEAGNFRLAQSIAVDLPPEERITARQFAAVDRDPVKALAHGDFAWAHVGGRELALYALERAARADPVAARAAWLRQRTHLPAAERLVGNARLAFHAARQLAPAANDWYREAAGAPMNELQRAWQVRAALRVGAWPEVLAAIDAMPGKQAQEASWRYWRARALAALGRADEAAIAYAALAHEANFYGVLSSEALGRATLPGRIAEAVDPSPPAPSATALDAFGARAGVARTVRLARLGMRPESQREWVYVIRGADDQGLLVAAEYARRQGLYDRAINTADRTVAHHDFGLRYLTPYREHFSAAARDSTADEALLFGIARQESRFSSNIVSSAGAVGLMQLMPPTAKWVARQLGHSDYRASEISDVGVNTRFGAYYFKYWHDRLDRLPALAAAAYNAGPGRAQAWRAGVPLEGAIWVETIPFNETRDYVKKVLTNAMFYARELNQPYLSLTARLGTVPPRGGAGEQFASRIE